MDPAQPPDPLTYYNAETYLFPELAHRFAETGKLTAEELYLILDWKASRARTKHRDRLVRKAGSFDTAARQLVADIVAAADAEHRMYVLLRTWDFALPTASAVLSVLYPEAFTVYDIRVCNALGAFHRLGTMKPGPEMWREYQRFMEHVRAEAPPGFSLRDCDRWLWGRDKQARMIAELSTTDGLPKT